MINQADHVGETVVTMDAVKYRPLEQYHDLKVCNRCAGASVRVAALLKTMDSLAYEIFQYLNCESIEWISRADRNMR